MDELKLSRVQGVAFPSRGRSSLLVAYLSDDFLHILGL